MISIILLYICNMILEYFNIDLFKDLSNKDKRILASNSVVTTYSKGDLIINKGTINNQLILLVDGFVKVFAETGNEKRIIDILKKDRILSIISIFTDKVYNLSASAVSSCTVVVFEKDIFLDVVKNNFQFSQHLSKTISELSIKYMYFLAFQNKKNVRGRVAEVLMYLSDRVYESLEFPQSFTRKEMADMSNTTTETIIRIFSEFKKDGIITIDKKVIKIENIEFLSKLAKNG